MESSGLPNIVFRASAGTGKTHQIVRFYTALILGRRYLPPPGPEGEAGAPIGGGGPEAAIPPNKILLMTFTENAAAELRARCLEHLTAALYAAVAEGGSGESLIRRRLRQVQTAPISTIHSFCATLLRRHPLEAGVSPNFTILEGPERAELLDACLYETLVRRVETDSQLREAVRLFSVGNSLAFARKAGELLSRHLGDRTPAVDTARPPPARAAELAQSILEENSGRGKIPALIRDQWSPETISQAEETELREFAHTVTNALKSRSKDLNVARLQRWASAWVAAGKWGGTVQKLWEYARAAHQAFQAAKNERNLLDFQDLITRAVRLLRARPEIARGRDGGEPLFRTVIVDEVQDNSWLQFHLLKALWTPGINNLVICGDPKQSIYGWRDADIRVMPELEQAMEAAQTASGAPFRRIYLRTSYRSQPALVEAINRVQKTVFQEALGSKDRSNLPVRVDYAREALEARSDAGIPSTPASPVTAACTVELLEPGEDLAETPLEERIAREARAVAARILLLVQGPPGWRPAWIFHGTGWRRNAPDAPDPVRYRFRDVCILLLRTTYQDYYEEALREFGIPYTLGGKGRGFFQRPEVRDIHNMLHTLVDPFDPLPLLAFLRSPFACVDDRSIARLAKTEQPATFDARRLPAVFADPDQARSASDRAGLPPEARDAVVRAARLLALGRAVAGRMNAVQTARRMIAEAGYDAVQSGSLRGEARLANLRKLLDWIAGQERQGINLLSDVVRLLGRQIESNIEEPEAPILDPDQDAVRILTVHASKGLTSPVVFIPDTRARKQNERRPVVHAESAPKPRRADADIQVSLKFMGGPEAGRIYESTGFADADDRARRRREAERRNLFYVAMTRARDLVVFSGEPLKTGNRNDEPQAGSEWRRWLDRCLGTTQAEWWRRRRYEEVVAQAESLRKPPEQVRASPEYRERLRSLAAKFQAESRPPPAFYSVTATALCHAWLAAQGDGEAASGKGETDVRKTDRNEDGWEADSQEYGMSAADFGTLGHAVFERLDWTLEPAERSAQAAELIRESVPPGPACDELQRRIQKALQSQAALFESIARARERYAELPFAFRLPIRFRGSPVFAIGTFDLVWKGPEGWRLLDYKFMETNRIDSARRRYWLQIALYARAMAELGMEPLADSRLLLLGSNDSRTVPVGVESGPIPWEEAVMQALEYLFREAAAPASLG